MDAGAETTGRYLRRAQKEYVISYRPAHTVTVADNPLLIAEQAVKAYGIAVITAV